MNIEKLLGKLLEEAVGSSGGQLLGRTSNSYGKKKTYQNQSVTGSLLGSLTSQLSSGKGLMTAIGLGVGAYEIFRNNGQAQPQATAAPQNWASASGMPASPPPPPPPPSSVPAPVMPATSAISDDQELACRLIRVMIAAAYADGTMDADEEKAILDRLRGVELSQEEKMFLLNELHHPRTIAELTQGINDLRLAQAMYAVALSAIVVDTDSERQWLDELGAALNLSPAICRFIEETA